MSIFGFYFVSELLREAGWPRKKGRFNNTAVIDTLILDHAIDQMIDWAAALGAGRPTLALQTIAEMFGDRDWNTDGRPDIKVFIEDTRTENEGWRVTDPIAPHEIVQPMRFAGAGAHHQAVEGILKTGPKWKGPTIPLKGFKEFRVPLEYWYLYGLLWGLGNPKAFETWYDAHFEDRINNLEAMVQAGLEIEAPSDLAQFLADSENILRNYERDIGPLPEIPDSLLADAKALGRDV